MSDTQQEAYHLLFKSSPQNLYQGYRMLMMMKQFAQEKERKKQDLLTREEEWERFSELREELGLETPPEMRESFMALNKHKRAELLRDCEKKILLQAGEKDLDYFMSSNKMLAEPQLLDKHINLEQLKNVMEEYGMQFHIKELADKTKELHFFAKDANIAAHAINKTLDELLKDPEKVTKPTLEMLIKQAKEKTQAQQETHEKTKEAAATSKAPEKATEEAKETLDAISLFDEGGIDL
ncbi:hypothetical protein [uncultured Enterococcus sp.]|uniref:hypothetical protein n=1 Tax=uncultured Enterococcus sp. TaxID=167972 RepID=UPI002AA79E12|nr:hypothetical protein [uncultured Enterococcus sp.]